VQSRSTSAGSSPIVEHLDPLPAQNSFSPFYPADALGLPDYDYPSQWSIERAPQLTEGGYISKFFANDAFLGTDVRRQTSLQAFFEERKIQSCPTSSIGLPPGLEDLVKPEDAAARLVAFESEVNELPPAADMLPAGLFDAPLDCEAPEFLPSFQSAPLDFNAPEFLPLLQRAPLDCNAPEFLPSLQRAPLDCNAPEFLPSFQSNTLDCEVPEFLPSFQQSEHYFTVHSGVLSTSPSLHPQQHQSFVLDLAAVLASQAQRTPTQQEPFLDGQCLPTPALEVQSCSSDSEFVSSHDCPTLGSQGHWQGNCRPCAFLYTRGCASGASCAFCHLCGAGEKKRRAKEARVARKPAHLGAAVR